MSGAPNTALDLLEAEVLREARQHLEPDRARIEGLWRSVATASALGAAASGVNASVAPASGTGWAAPRPPTTSPSAAPAPTPGPTPTVELAPAIERPGVLQRWGQASFGFRALVGALVGGALLGFAAGYGSAGGPRNAIDPPGAAPSGPSSTSRSSTGMTSQATSVETVEVTPGVALGSLEADSLDAPVPQVPAALANHGAKPQVDQLEAAPGSSEPSQEPAKPSFYEELEYLKRAQSALRQGNGALALGLMTSLDSLQPDGALLSERGVIRVLAHCQLGDVESATLVAERLATHGLASVYAERLENSCAGAVLSK